MKFAIVTALVALCLATPAAAQRFLASPLGSDVYAPGTMTSVLDHSMVRNENGLWQYGRTNTVGYGGGSARGGDGVVIGFNGERANGAAKGSSNSDIVCIAGAILLKPTPQSPSNTAMTNTGGCGAGYASYDEHPGYDYRAARGTPVLAAAGGRVVGTVAQPCIPTNITSCSDMGYIGIDHGNGYVTQYGHLDLTRTHVNAGDTITQGQRIGYSGSTGVSAPHLHFEVLYRSGGTYYVVDPYGWVGSGNDPLYSRAFHTPRQLWQ